ATSPWVRRLLHCLDGYGDGASQRISREVVPLFDCLIPLSADPKVELIRPMIFVISEEDIPDGILPIVADRETETMLSVVRDGQVRLEEIAIIPVIVE